MIGRSSSARRSTTPPPTPGTSMIASTQSFFPASSSISRIALAIWPAVFIVSALVVGAVHPYPATFSPHDHRLVLAEASDVGRDDRTAGAFERSFLCCLDPLGQDQGVVRDVRELTEHLGLVDGACDTPAD